MNFEEARKKEKEAREMMVNCEWVNGEFGRVKCKVKRARIGWSAGDHRLTAALLGKYLLFK